MVSIDPFSFTAIILEILTTIFFGITYKKDREIKYWLIGTALISIALIIRYIDRIMGGIFIIIPFGFFFYASWTEFDNIVRKKKREIAPDIEGGKM